MGCSPTPSLECRKKVGFFFKKLNIEVLLLNYDHNYTRTECFDAMCSFILLIRFL